MENATNVDPRTAETLSSLHKHLENLDIDMHILRCGRSVQRLKKMSLVKIYLQLKNANFPLKSIHESKNMWLITQNLKETFAKTNLYKKFN